MENNLKGQLAKLEDWHRTQVYQIAANVTNGESRPSGVNNRLKKKYKFHLKAVCTLEKVRKILTDVLPG